MRLFKTTDWLIAAICLSLIAMAFMFSWGTIEEAPPQAFTLDFKETTDFFYSLAIAGPVLIFILNMTELQLRPAFVFLLSLASASPFVWFVGNFIHSSLTSEVVLFNDRFWILRIISIPFWIELALVLLLVALTGWLVFGSSTIEIEEYEEEIQSV